MRLSRRQLLGTGGTFMGLALAGLCGAAVPVPAAGAEPRSIALDNLHTGEHLNVEYFRDGRYVAPALLQVEVLLRDFRNGEQHEIDPSLLDHLVELARGLSVEPRFSVISGYRSPHTNQQLHEHSSGVAQHSLHMQGRAMDVRLRQVDCAQLAAHAERLRHGGVGYYRASNFVHLDTGAFRTWRG